MRFLFLIMFVFSITVITGCGGGGHDATLHGFANINEAAEHPKIATLDLVNGEWRRLTVASLKRPSYGWQDIEFNLKAPDHYSGMVITVVVFNDTNHNNSYDGPNELLGFMDHFLEWEDGHYVIAEGDTVYVWDALDTDLYIDCSFTRSVLNSASALNFESMDSKKKAAAQKQH